MPLSHWWGATPIAPSWIITLMWRRDCVTHWSFKPCGARPPKTGHSEEFWWNVAHRRRKWPLTPVFWLWDPMNSMERQKDMTPWHREIGPPIRKVCNMLLGKSKGQFPGTYFFSFLKKFFQQWSRWQQSICSTPKRDPVSGCWKEKHRGSQNARRWLRDQGWKMMQWRDEGHMGRTLTLLALFAEYRSVLPSTVP